MENSEFEVRLNKLLSEEREKLKSEYNRVLPTNELLFNRFDKAKYLNFGENTSVYDSSIIMGDVEVGDNVWIGPYTLLEGLNGKLKIGNFVSIDTGVTIYTHDSTKYQVSGGVDSFEKGDVVIGDNTVIGTMSMIACGVHIGKHCVIGAHSFVKTDIEDNKIAAGCPAKVIGEVIINEDGSVSFVYY